MTAEEKKARSREYQRNWRKQNKERLQEYRKDAAIRKAIRDINNGNAIVTTRKILVMEHDERYSTEE